VDGSEFVVSRVAYINDKSDYFINGTKAKRGDVVDLLKSRGIDLDNNRFLILQVSPSPSLSLSVSTFSLISDLILIVPIKYVLTEINLNRNELNSNGIFCF
jgi:hypothetical protein